MSCWFSSLLIIFCNIRWLMGHICPRFSCFQACSLELSQSQPGLAAYPEDPRLLGSPKYPSSIFTPSSSSIFLPLRAKLDFFFSLFCEVKSLPIHGLGSLPMALNGFGPSLFLLKARMFSRFQSFVLFWALIQHHDILDLKI